MRTNKACPKFIGESTMSIFPCVSFFTLFLFFSTEGVTDVEPVNVAMTEQDEESILEDSLMDIEGGDEELTTVDGTRLKVSAKLMKHQEEIRRKMSTVLER